MNDLYASLQAGIIAVLCIIGFTASCQAADGGDSAKAARAATTFSCTACHGPGGRGSRSIPKIGGLDSKDIVQSLKGFRSGEEKQTIMGRVAQNYSDEEFELMAQFFSAMR